MGSPIDDQAKLMTAGLETAGKAIDLVHDTGKAFAALFGPPAVEVMGMVTDSLALKRKELFLEGMAKSTAKLRASGVEPRPVSPSVAVPLIEGLSAESRPEIQELWTDLLAAARDPDRSNQVRREFIDILKAMEPMDARVFAGMPLNFPLSGDPHWMQASRHLGLPQNEVHLSILHLLKLGCIEDALDPLRASQVPGDRIRPTVLGQELRRVLGL
jgi:hypothetical protein